MQKLVSNRNVKCECECRIVCCILIGLTPCDTNRDRVYYRRFGLNEILSRGYTYTEDDLKNPVVNDSRHREAGTIWSMTI